MIHKIRLIKIISEALEVTDIDTNSSMENTDEWDSLGRISILVKLDKELDGRASGIEELGSADSVSKIINALTVSGDFIE